MQLPWPSLPCGRTLAEVCLAMVLVVAGASQNKPLALDLEGKSVNPLAAAAGKVGVLVFLRTDCPVSNRYAPVIQRISAQYHDQSQFYLVFPDKAESAGAIRKYLSEFSYKLPALRDPDHTLVKQAHVQITPEVAVFDKTSGLIYHGRMDNLYEDFSRARPAATTHELEDAIQAALKGTRPSVAETSAIGCYISDLQ